MIRLCGERVVVEPYGGGHRWYCPVCDFRQERFSIITWTNSPPPAYWRCPNVAKKRPIDRLMERGVHLQVF